MKGTHWTVELFDQDGRHRATAVYEPGEPVIFSSAQEEFTGCYYRLVSPTAKVDQPRQLFGGLPYTVSPDACPLCGTNSLQLELLRKLREALLP